MENKRIGVLWYKGNQITYYKGSNYVYVGNRPFESLHSAKCSITRFQNRKVKTKKGSLK